MSKESIKLARIKKSCHVVGIVTKVIFIICVVLTVLALTSGIVFAANHKALNSSIENLMESFSSGDASNAVAYSASVYSSSGGGLLNKYFITSFDSSVPAIKEAINETPYSIAISIYSFAAALIIAMTALSMFLLFSVFSFIEKEDTPFSDRALKKLLVSLIIIDVVIGLTSSPGFGVIGGLITWAVYTIMDYGRTLQIQSDETL